MSVTYNGTDLETTYGMVCLGRGTYGAPARDIEQVHVPGRNGDLLIDNGGYMNFDLVYPECTIQEDFPYQARALRNFLLSSPGYHKLTDSYNPGFYRLAEYRGPFAAEAHTARNNMSSVFDLSFNCKPMRYLDSAAAPDIYLVGAGTSRVPYISSSSSLTITVNNAGSDAITAGVIRAVSQESVASISVQAGASETIYVDSSVGEIFLITVDMSESSAFSVYINHKRLYSRGTSPAETYIYNGFQRAECETFFRYWKGTVAHEGGSFALTGTTLASIDSETYETNSSFGLTYMTGVAPALAQGGNAITLTVTDTGGTPSYVHMAPRFCLL